ncbi:5-formyltetrahydrofolate cyclo-ligase [Actinoplanes sp. NPDC049265]|uniref:5-formyltetrahydrofolate cyclo-ligase n=1 Tax=Actinoplanes sp. NPDC049265 TaxID=3363902 RepID=UPI0037187DE1
MSEFALDAERSKAAKVALRDRLITARRSLAEAVRRSADASVQASTITWVRAQQPTICAAYAPVGTEPGGSDLPERLAEACTVLLPVLLDDGDLDWAVYDGTARRTRRGLLEPTGKRLGPQVIAEVPMIVVPALAVSRDGVRMGRGGGSYDRVLARAGHARTVALLHDGELLDAVPAEPHDQRVGAVITPSGGLIATSGWTK